MEKDIHVFICEDNDVATKIVANYFAHGQVTYAELFKESERPAIVKALESVHEQL